MEGTTLAMDFRNQEDATLKLMADLDRIVLEAGGRLYPAKDGRIPADLFQAGISEMAGIPCACRSGPVIGLLEAGVGMTDVKTGRSPRTAS